MNEAGLYPVCNKEREVRHGIVEVVLSEDMKETVIATWRMRIYYVCEQRRVWTEVIV